MGYVEVVVVLDRSGSMSTRVDDAIGGYNTFVKNLQDVPGDAFLTLAQFDDIYEIVYDHEELMKVTLLDKSVYVPRGSTALLDAVGRTIMSIRGKIAGYSDKPDKVIVCILTDGQENCSKEFNKEKVFELVEESQRDGWEFVFLGADKDSINDAHSYGIPSLNVFLYDSTSVSGTRDACNTMSSYVNTTRNMAHSGMWPPRNKKDKPEKKAKVKKNKKDKKSK